MRQISPPGKNEADVGNCSCNASTTGRKYGQLILSSLLFTLLLPRPTRAEVVLDGSMGRSGDIAGPNYLITSDLGRQVGANLFHSFTSFNLEESENAIFSGPNGINNIIARVTGGTPSSLDGGIIATANFFFMNPSGIVFGPHASIGVNGSFHATTADYLRLGSDGTISATTPEQSLLTVSPPSAFGFTTATPKGITVNGAPLVGSAGASLSLVAGDISLHDSTLYAMNGEINLVSAASVGEVELTGNGEVLTSGFSRFGSIRLDDDWRTAFIDTQGNPIGNLDADGIVMRGDAFIMDGGLLYSKTYGPDDGHGIDISLTGEMRLGNTGSNPSPATILSQTMGSGQASDITIAADTITLADASQVGSLTTDTGRSGALSLAERLLTVTGKSQLVTQTAGDGGAGDIVIDTEFLKVEGGGHIASDTFASGNGGGITLHADQEIRVEGVVQEEGAGLTHSAIQSTARQGSHGHSGALTITTPSLMLDNQANISTQTLGSGDAGAMAIDVDTLTIRGGATVDSNTWSSGTGGAIDISANESITLDGFVTDPSGQYSRSSIQSAADSGSTGTGGSITLATPNLNVEDHAAITTKTLGSGNAGTITVETESLHLNGEINSSTGGAGNGEEIVIHATREVLIEGYVEQALGHYFNAGIYSEVGQESSGHGGTITLTTPSLALEDFSFISTAVTWEVDPGRAIGTGNAGDIALAVDSLKVHGGSVISSDTAGVGQGGMISVTAKDGIDIQGFFKKNTGELTPSEISAGTRGPGRGGSLFIVTPSLQLSDHGGISVETSGDGRGGDLALTTDQLDLQTQAKVSSESTGTGLAGDITIAAANRLTLTNSAITAATTDADGGNIHIDPELMLLRQSDITATVKGGTGNGGNIDLAADNLVLDRSRIIANAEAGNGGNISLASQVFLKTPDTMVSASSRFGIQGTVVVYAPLVDVTAGLVTLPEKFLDGESFTAKRCVDNAQEASSLVVKGRDGVPARPDTLISTP